MGEGALYPGLFVGSFLAATLLPGGSEALLAAVLLQAPEHPGLALALATVGNTLGGLTSYGLGRMLPDRASARSIELVRRYGPVTLLAAWLPLVGDPLCVAAGWLRLPLLPVTLFMAIGKFVRYGFLAHALSP